MYSLVLKGEKVTHICTHVSLRPVCIIVYTCTILSYNNGTIRFASPVCWFFYSFGFPHSIGVYGSESIIHYFSALTIKSVIWLPYLSQKSYFGCNIYLVLNRWHFKVCSMFGRNEGILFDKVAMYLHTCI